MFSSPFQRREDNCDARIYPAQFHAEKLAVFIRDIMEMAVLPYSQLDAIAVGTGPGSYTGLRIGTSTAKGLCYALNRPLLAIPTLKAMALAAAAQAQKKEYLLLPYD